MTHAGKIKCIYIDPPYNTGNRDFIYNDRFIDKEDSYRHSKWLEFMYRRLQLARELLTEDGVIFVSIDDGEACHLKLLMDNVFGASNFIGQMIWKSRQNKDNRTKNGASIDHEYVIVYGSSLRGVERDREQFKNPDNDPRGPWTSGNMVGLADEKARPNLHYELVHPDTQINYGKPKQGWRFDRNRMASLIAENRILWPEKSTGRPRLKVFLHEMKSEFTGYSSIVGNQIYTYHGTRELEDIFNIRSFDFPKPSDLIMELIRQGTSNKNDLVLDFFAGSGTTAHALLKLNAEDGGNRRFILVSSTEATSDEPDKNLCRDVCAERVRRVMQGYTNKKGEAVAGLGGSFAYLRTQRLAAETLFSTLQHESIWLALQLIHQSALQAYQADALLQLSQHGSHSVVYLPLVRSESVQAVAALLADDGQITAYCWNPGALRQALANERLSVLPIPQFLVDRFGSGSTS